MGISKKALMILSASLLLAFCASLHASFFDKYSSKKIDDKYLKMAQQSLRIKKETTRQSTRHRKSPSRGIVFGHEEAFFEEIQKEGPKRKPKPKKTKDFSDPTSEESEGEFEGWEKTDTESEEEMEQPKKKRRKKKKTYYLSDEDPFFSDTDDESEEEMEQPKKKIKQGHEIGIDIREVREYSSEEEEPRFDRNAYKERWRNESLKGLIDKDKELKRRQKKAKGLKKIELAEKVLVIQDLIKERRKEEEKPSFNPDEYKKKWQNASYEQLDEKYSELAEKIKKAKRGEKKVLLDKESIILDLLNEKLKEKTKEKKEEKIYEGLKLEESEYKYRGDDEDI